MKARWAELMETNKNKSPFLLHLCLALYGQADRVACCHKNLYLEKIRCCSAPSQITEAEAVITIQSADLQPKAITCPFCPEMCLSRQGQDFLGWVCKEKSWPHHDDAPQSCEFYRRADKRTCGLYAVRTGAKQWGGGKQAMITSMTWRKKQRPRWTLKIDHTCLLFPKVPSQGYN